MDKKKESELQTEAEEPRPTETEYEGGGNVGLTAYGQNSNCEHLGTIACACFAQEVDGDWAIKGIITVLLRGTIDADANKGKTFSTCLSAIYHS